MDDPMKCERVGPMLSGYLDNELSPAEASAVAHHCESCAACRAEYDALRAARAAMRDHLPVLAAPDLLRSRVAAALRSAQTRDATPVAAPSRRPFWLRQVAAGLVIAVASSAVTRSVLHQSPGDSAITTHDVVATHVRSLMTNHLTDIVSTDEHNVKPWFDGRVAFAPDVPRLDSTGFPLVGGRVDTIGREPVAALVYGRRKHVINVFTWPTLGGSRAGTEILSATEHGYNVLRWVRGDMQFAAVSDLAAVELRQFVEAFRQTGAAGVSFR
jgi:anti-sigma factor RsiW